MYIMSQDADAHIEYHGAALKKLNDGTVNIVAAMPNGTGKVIGTYTYDRAQLILSEIAANSVTGTKGMYVMPDK